MNFEHVIIVTNPLKTITINTSVKSKHTKVKSLIPDGYIDLKVGLWNIALDYIIARAPLDQIPEKTIFDINSSLVTNISYTNNTEFCIPESQFATLGQFDLNFKESNATSYYLYKKFTPLWFFVDQPHAAKFEIEITQNKLTQLQTPIKFDAQIGLLFQRIN
jgi:hypothetical protein